MKSIFSALKSVFFHENKFLIINKLGQVLFYFLVAVLPLFFIAQYSIGLALQKQALVLSVLFFVFVLFSIFSIQNGKFFAVFSWPLFFLSLFFAYVFLNFLSVGAKEYALFGLSYDQWSSVANVFLALMLAFFLSSFFQDRRKIIDILYVLIFSFVISFLIYYFFSFNLVGSEYILAVFSAVLFFVSFALAGEAGNKFLKGLLYILSFWFLYFLFFLKAKVLLLFVFVLLALGIVYYFSSKEFFKKERSVFYLSLLSFALILFFFFQINGNLGEDRIRISPQGEWDIIKNEYQASSKNLLFGYGPASFRYVFLEFKPVIPDLDLSRVELVFGFSPFFDYLAELGIFGTMIFLLFLGSSLFYVGKALFYRLKDKNKDFVLFALFASSLILLFSFFAYPPNMIGLYLLVFVFMLSVLLVKVSQKTQMEFSFLKNNKIFFGYILASIFVLSLFVYISNQFYKEAKSIAYFAYAKEALSKNNVNLAKDYAVQAIKVYDKDDYIRFFADLEAQQLLRNIQKRKMNDSLTKEIQRIEALYQNAISKNQKEYLNYYHLALFYDNLTKDDLYTKKAILYYQKALLLNKTSADILFNLGKAFYKIKDYKSAKKVFEMLALNYPNQADIRLNLALTYFALGEYEKSIDEFKKAKKLNPKFILDDAIKTAKERLQEKIKNNK